MIQGLYNSAAASDGLGKWVDVVTRNISSGSTPGFKRDAMVFEGVLNGVVGFSAGGSTQMQHNLVSPLPSVGINFGVGDMHRTGDPNECAIEGEGFFRLQRPDGEYVYTRDGQFRISPEGQMMSKQGFPVMGFAGPVQLLVDQGPFTIEADGRVRQGDQEVGTISVFNFENLADLRRTSGGFIMAPDGESPSVSTLAQVRQGYHEMSNATAMREMANLITISTALQANQKVMQNIDGVMDRAVQVLGNPN